MGGSIVNSVIKNINNDLFIAFTKMQSGKGMPKNEDVEKIVKLFGGNIVNGVIKNIDNDLLIAFAEMLRWTWNEGGDSFVKHCKEGRSSSKTY